MTAATRCAAIRFARPWASVLAVPATSGVDQAERQTLAYMYSGILAGDEVIPPPAPPVEKSAGAYLKRWYQVGDRKVYGSRRAVSRLLWKLAQEHAEEDAKEAAPQPKPRKVIPIPQGVPAEVVQEMSHSPQMAERVEKTYRQAYEKAYREALRQIVRRKMDEERDDEESILMLL